MLPPHPRPDHLILGHHTRPHHIPPLVRVATSARAAHLYVIGMSGKGKSKLLEACLYQDIAAGRGCGLIDPHSLLADDLLRLLITRKGLDTPKIRHRLIYVDPARADFVIPFNVLDIAGEHPYDVAATVLEAFRRTWPECLKEAPHFSNVVTAALIVLIQNHLTLMQMPRLLTDKDFRESCLERVTDQNIIEFFHDRYDRWGREAPVLRESTLNKIGAFSLNPRLKLMLGQQANHLDFRAMMDEGKILLLDLGHCDGETNRLIGSLVVTSLELAMRRRKKRTLWNLTIDEFAGYVANEGSVKTLAHVFSEGRKFKMSMTVAHQDLSQLTPRMLGALSNVQTKVIFGIGRYDAEYFAKLIGYVDAETVKRDAKTETQHEMFSSLSEQWEQWVDRLRFQPARHATVAHRDGTVVRMKTLTIPRYTATDAQVEAVKCESLRRYGIPYAEAQRNVQAASADVHRPRARAPTLTDIPAFEMVTA
ncbi:MAG: type IV secretory system conjugative DNA transfer family protein [Anaerolineae bacterium]